MTREHQRVVFRKKMGMTMLKSKVYKKLKKCIVDHLAPDEVVNVIVEEAEDHDGDPILEIAVVTNVELASERFFGLGLRMRKTLLKMDEERYPIPTYKTTKEIEIAAK